LGKERREGGRERGGERMKGRKKEELGSEE
jgi:hypothetical protein